MNPIGRSAAVGALVLAAGLFPVACSSAPDSVDMRAKAPFGEFDYRWRKSSEPQMLPPGYVPQGQHPVTITIDGGTYTITICIARNPNDPNCIYINVGGCDAIHGWVKYCKNLANLTDGDPWAETIETCRCGGDISYNETTGQVLAQIVTGCAGLPVRSELVGVTIAHPTTPGVFLSSETFRATYGSTMPAGTTVQFATDTATALYNAALMEFDEFVCDSTTGDRVAGAIVPIGDDLPPLGILVVNEMVVAVQPVALP